jgi:peptidoglycan/LPS O-acetylase OafA/YrhL
MPEAKPINPLTSLRFFAAMWVVVYHYWPSLGGARPALVAKGYLGVELFFVLSGFILCHVYLDSVADGRFRYGGFLWARLARIYPLHLATLVGIGLMALIAQAAGHVFDSNVLSWPSLPANLLLVQAWGLAPQAGWNHPSWSISAEWFAYLLFPLFAWPALRLAKRPWTAAIGAFAALALSYAIFHALAGFPMTEANIRWGALRIVPSFAFGAALNLVWRAGAAKGRMRPLLGACVSGAGILAFAQVGAPDALLVALFGGLILSLAALAKAGENGGGGGLFVYLGEISYSIYMICIPWQMLYVNGIAAYIHVQKNAVPLSLWLIMLVALVPLAAASYHMVERPARRWMRGFTLARLEPATSVA